MSYINSKFIPHDIFTVIGRFLPYRTINILSLTNNSSFSKDSQIYKEYFHVAFPEVVKFCKINNYQSELIKIHNSNNLVDYACANGHLELLKRINPLERPSRTAIEKAFKNNHREIIYYLRTRFYISPSKYEPFQEDERCGQFMMAFLICLGCVLCSIAIFIVAILVIVKTIPLHDSKLVRGIVIFLLFCIASCCFYCGLIHIPMSFMIHNDNKTKNNGYTAL
jgi:hypothetical protein